MRLFPFVSLALTTALAAPAAAQTASQPNMVLTILAGAVTGHQLWTINKQPLCLLGAGGACSGNYDTLQLSRAIAPSLAVGVAATYFPWPHVGFHAEVSYLGLPIDDSCIGPVTYQPDPDERARQMCDNLGGQAGSGGAISLFVGATLRAATRRAFSPFLRGSVGMVNLSRSTVEVAGAYVDATGAQERLVIRDQNPRRRAPMFGAAAGFTSPLGTGYQFRLELRDVITSLERVTGPASDLAISPVATRYYHHFALILGLDVVLEKKRGRRY